MEDPLRAAIEAEYVIERDGWAFERVHRVTERLQSDIAVDARFETLVVWSESHGAFTAPGRTIYFSRRLLERLPDDDAAAFVVAHEIAHHRLGHVPRLSRAMLRLPLAIVLSLLAKWIAGAQREEDADLLAIEMCVDAGYELEKCLHALEQLAIIGLDYGDIEGVLGREDGTIARSVHPPTQHRIIAARVHAGRMKRGHRLANEIEGRRATRRRRMAIAAGAAAVGVLLLVIRRR